MKLGDTLSGLREARGLKQREVAEKSKITQAYLSQIENNRKEPNMSTLRAISEILEVPVPVIFFLSMEQNDFPEKKKEAFAIISPLIKSLINDLFIKSEPVV
jgi:transcriptional regulator with XRE-family HTH domain